ncbi:hypothetical protein [Helicobacter sp. T3_23-1059]
MGRLPNFVIASGFLQIRVAIYDFVIISFFYFVILRALARSISNTKTTRDISLSLNMTKFSSLRADLTKSAWQSTHYILSY